LIIELRLKKIWEQNLKKKKLFTLTRNCNKKVKKKKTQNIHQKLAREFDKNQPEIKFSH
jgi:hypothetical protein